MSAKKIEVNTIVIGLMVKTPRLVTTVPYDGKTAVIVGSRTNILDIDKVAIELLSEACTPSEPIIRSTAGDEFQEAATKLLKEGISFYTVTRFGWNLPALEWTKS